MFIGYVFFICYFVSCSTYIHHVVVGCFLNPPTNSSYFMTDPSYTMYNETIVLIASRSSSYAVGCTPQRGHAQADVMGERKKKKDDTTAAVF